MSKTSCVRRLPGDTFIVVRASYMLICGGNATAAALVHYFESWHNIKLSARDNFVNESPEKGPKQLPTLLQWHTTKMLEDALMGIGKKHSIQKARELLLDMGVITIHRNPNPNYLFDNTLHYLFHPDVVNNLLDKLPVNDAQAEIVQREQISAIPLAEISRTIPNDTLQGYKEEVPGLPPGGGKTIPKETVKKSVPATEPSKPREKKPAREFWQKFVDTWNDFYKAKKGEEPTIGGKYLTDLGKLYDHQLLRCKRKKGEWTEKYMVDALLFFLEAAHSEDWLSKHFLLDNLVTQFDAIYARANEKAQGQKKAKPFAEEIEYVIGRWKEGDLDERLLTPELYKKLEEKTIVPLGYREQFPGKDPDEQKRNAIKAWLTYLTTQTPTT